MTNACAEKFVGACLVVPLALACLVGVLMVATVASWLGASFWEAIFVGIMVPVLVRMTTMVFGPRRTERREFGRRVQ